MSHKSIGSAGDRHWTKSDKGDYKKSFLGPRTSHKICNELSACHMKRERAKHVRQFTLKALFIVVSVTSRRENWLFAEFRNCV